MYQKATIANLTLTLAATEYSQAMTGNIRKIVVKPRNNAGGKIQLAFVSGGSGSLFITIESGGQWSMDNIYLPTGTTLYMQTDQAGEIAEIAYWQDQ